MSVENRKFIGIGKIFIETPSVEWNIPHLHFLISETIPKTYEAINLEFGLVSTGESGMEAAGNLATLVHSHIISVIYDGNGYEELRETVRKAFMADYWTEYRGIEFDLAETGDDLSNNIAKHINKAIQESFNDELKKALKQEAGKAANEIISLLSLRAPVVEYKEIKERKNAA
jgi:hypothetical protein